MAALKSLAYRLEYAWCIGGECAWRGGVLVGRRVVEPQSDTPTPPRSCVMCNLMFSGSSATEAVHCDIDFGLYRGTRHHIFQCFQWHECCTIQSIISDMYHTSLSPLLFPGFILIAITSISSDTHSLSIMSLTTNAVSQMYRMGASADNPSFQPMVQCIHLKKIEKNGGDERWKVRSIWPIEMVFVHIHIIVLGMLLCSFHLRMLHFYTIWHV